MPIEYEIDKEKMIVFSRAEGDLTDDVAPQERKIFHDIHAARERLLVRR